NPLSKHVSLPLAQEEVAAGHHVPIARDGQQFRSTGEHSTAEDNAGKSQIIENVRTGIGGVVYGPGLAVSSVRRLFGPPGERASLPAGEPMHELPPGETTPHEPLPPPAPRPGDETGLPPAPRPGEEPLHDDVGAVKGSEVYPQNTYEKNGVQVPSKLNDEKIKKAIKPAASQLGDVTLSSPVVKDGVATFQLTVPHAGGTADVSVHLTTKAPGDLSPSPAHGDDAGPARFVLDHDATSGRWTLRVEIDSTVRPEDVQFVLGHELNEATELVRRNPGGKPSGGFADDMQAGVMKPGATATAPTAHDIAAAREVTELDKELAKVKKNKSTNPAAIKDREDVLERAIHAEGLDDPTQIGAKLALLRGAGASPELLRRVEMVQVKQVLGAHEAALGRPSTLDPELVRHLLFAEKGGRFTDKGLNGGHHTEELRRFVETSDKYALLEVKTKSAGGTTLREFEQYQWNGGGPRPAPGSNEAPGGSAFDASKWTKSTQPKTTFDDPAAFLREAEAAWNTWLASGATPGRERDLVMTSPSGIQFGGFVKDLTAPYQLATIFVEASWM
ncbi:MAG TPA: hypothetical protein VF488_02800, partial [Gemmatimonadaceae bacterium]